MSSNNEYSNDKNNFDSSSDAQFETTLEEDEEWKQFVESIEDTMKETSSASTNQETPTSPEPQQKNEPSSKQKKKYDYFDDVFGDLFNEPPLALPELMVEQTGESSKQSSKKVEKQKASSKNMTSLKRNHSSLQGDKETHSHQALSQLSSHSKVGQPVGQTATPAGLNIFHTLQNGARNNNLKRMLKNRPGLENLVQPVFDMTPITPKPYVIPPKSTAIIPRSVAHNGNKSQPSEETAPRMKWINRDGIFVQVPMKSNASFQEQPKKNRSKTVKSIDKKQVIAPKQNRSATVQNRPYNGKIEGMVNCYLTGFFEGMIGNSHFCGQVKGGVQGYISGVFRGTVCVFPPNMDLKTSVGLFEQGLSKAAKVAENRLQPNSSTVPNNQAIMHMNRDVSNDNARSSSSGAVQDFKRRAVMQLDPKYALIGSISPNKDLGRFKRLPVDKASYTIEECLSKQRLQRHLDKVSTLNLTVDPQTQCFEQLLPNFEPKPMKYEDVPVECHLMRPIPRVRYLRGRKYPTLYDEGRLDGDFALVTNNTRFDIGDYYSPEFVKIAGHSRRLGKSKAGLCPYCPEPKFFELQNSSYAHHLTKVHGVLASRVILDPVNYGTYQMSCGGIPQTIKHGVSCPVCTCVVDLQSGEQRYARYFDHFAKHHR